MKTLTRAMLFAAILSSSTCYAGSYKVYSTYLWHLQQPIYWPEKASGLPRYQFAYESMSGSATYPGHPQNNLSEIFGTDDREAAYQWRPRDAVSSMGSGNDAGAQLSYAGSLIENVWSLGDNYSLDYSPTWYSSIREAMGWTTTRSKRKLEPVGFAYHHALMPLIDRDARRKEIAINKDIWWKAWNGSADHSDHPKGFRCSEEAFSIRIIKELVEAGYEWVIVPNHHLSRTHPNYVQLHGSGIYDLPNRADQINENNDGGWYYGNIDGRGSTESIPFSFQAHRAQYVDPDTGTEYEIVIVPMTDLGSYRDGYSTTGVDILDDLNDYADYDQPCLALFSHDGDNAWGGGYSYYLEAVPNFVSSAASAGYRPSTIQTFLDENPPPSDDLVHVEDGAWFNAESDWGHPQYVNWLWPPQRDRSSASYSYSDPSTYGDITNGWAEDFRNWAVIVAAQNFVSTAEQIHTNAGGSFDNWKVQEPIQRDGTDNGANNAELAWHYFLGSLDSGYMYYGTSLDMEVKPTLACNQAIGYASQVIDSYPATNDLTPPTVFIPQRYPYNPGTTNYGAIYGYKSWVAPVDFHIWTFAYDVSGVTQVVLKIRTDNNGVNPLSDNDNEIYTQNAGSVGAWNEYVMNERDGSTFVSNIFNNSGIDFFIMPTNIADEYWYYVTGTSNVLYDYYVEAYDSLGNVQKTDIQHVYVGSEEPISIPAVTSLVSSVAFSPAAPNGCEDVTITYSPNDGPLSNASPVYIHIGRNGWLDVLTNNTEMTQDGTNWTYVYSPEQGTIQINCVFHDGSGIWDNNSGDDWAVDVENCSGGQTESVIRMAAGSPVINDDPGDQNSAGDAFDFNQTGGDATTVDQGGFGSFGHIYINYDETNFYIGGTDCNIAGSNNAMIVFLNFDTLTDDKNNLWDESGLPQGLDYLHNLRLEPAMDIAIVLGDEYGDATYPSFNLGDGYDFGQGLYYLSSTNFVEVSGAKLSQFDGSGTNATASTDDDGDRLMDRWEASIPWTSLNATGVASIASCYLAGLLANSDTNGLDRYISGNYLGLSATNDAARDAYDNFAFTFVTLEAVEVQLPDDDTDDDGLPDDWESRYFGGPTNATVDIDSDDDGFSNNDEYLLGTHPLSDSSLFELMSVGATGSLTEITWTSVGGKNYLVDYSDDLLIGFSNAQQVVEDDVDEGSGTTETFSESQTTNSVRVYRVRLAP